MALPNYKELTNFSNVEAIDEEIFLVQKNLFELRIKRSTNQSVKPHLFKHLKRRVAQLNFKKHTLLQLINNT